VHAQVDRDDERPDAGPGSSRPGISAAERDDRDDQAHQAAHQGQRKQDEGDPPLRHTLSVRAVTACGGSRGFVPRAIQPFRIGSEARHLAEWRGHEAAADFRFPEPTDIGEAIEGGTPAYSGLEHTSYPQQIRTRRVPAGPAPNVNQAEC
jgi:hypothetical protein